MAYLAVTASLSTINVYQYGNDMFEHIGILEWESDGLDNLDVHCFTPDCSCVIGSVCKYLLIWDMTAATENTGTPNMPPVTIKATPESSISLDANSVEEAVLSRMSGHDRLAVRTSGPKFVMLFDLVTRQELWRVASPSRSNSAIYFTRNDELICTGIVTGENMSYLNPEGTIQVIDTSTGTVVAEIMVPQDQTRVRNIRQWALHPVEPLLALAVRGRYDIILLRLSAQFSTLVENSDQHRLEGHTSSVSHVRFSDDGMTLVSGSDDRSIRIWNAVTWEVMLTIPTLVRIYKIAFSMVNKRIALCSFDDDDVRIFDSESGQLVMADISSIGNLCFSIENTVIFM
jgi:WD40 repeat protein